MDQLILQMFKLTDHLLKDMHIESKMTLYDALAFTEENGIVEFVLNSRCVQAVLEEKKYEKSYIKMLEEFSGKNVDPALCMDKKAYPTLQRVRKDIFENFKDSMAVYSVITYLLGIGDRHQENILINPDGCVFHIDFGYTFGNDPTTVMSMFYTFSFMKFTKPMLDVFEGDLRQKFEEKIIYFYTYLRKNYKIFAHMLYSLLDSQLCVNPKTKDTLSIDSLVNMMDRFSIDKTDRETEVFIKTLVLKSVSLLEDLRDLGHLIKGKISK